MDKQYFYYVNGKPVEVSREVYEVLILSDNKMRYFEKGLKCEKVIRKNGESVIRPSREDSLEWLLAMSKQFADNSANVEDAVIGKCMTELPRKCLTKLTDTEMELITALYFECYSEVQLSQKTGIPRTTLQSQKYKLLAKLRNLMEK